MSTGHDEPLGATAMWMAAADATAEPAPDREFQATVERAMAGDPAAFEAIVSRYERRILTLAWRLLGNLDDAKDAAQEAFVRAFKYLHRYDAGRPLEGWLVRIATNVCRDLRRSGQRRMATEPEGPLPSSALDPIEHLVLDERKRLLDHALGRLLEKERSAIVLRDLEGLSTADTAAILGLSQSAVRALIGRARVKIRHALSGTNGGLP